MDTSAFFDSFFDHAKQNAIIIMDEHGNVLKVNKAFTDHLDIRRRILLKKISGSSLLKETGN